MWIHCRSQSSYVQMWAEFCSDKRHLLQIPCVCFSLQGCMQTGQEARGVCCNKCWCLFLARITSLRQAILRHYHGSTSSETAHSKNILLRVLWNKTLHSPALLLQPRCCGILPCHLTPCLSDLAAPWHGKAFPQFRHTKEQFPLRVECKKPVHTPGFCSQTVFNNYSAGTQYVWVPFSKSDYIWLRDVTGWKGQTGQTCMFMQCDSISHQRRTFICHLCDLFLFSSSTVC